MGPCMVCGGTQFNDGYCVNCGRLQSKPNRLPLVLVGVGVLVAACLVATVAGLGLWQWNRTRNAAQTIPVTPGRSAEPTENPTEEPPLTGAACLVGRWRETVYQSDATISGAKVRLNGAGALQEFTAAGVAVYDVSAGTTQTGTSSGNTYTLTVTGKITFNYQVVGTEIHYSNAQGSGTRVWRRNGRQIDQQALVGSLAPETFTCTGDKLRLYSTDYSVELDRLTA